MNSFETADKEIDKIRDDREREYEFCPRCNANLTLQRGYHADLPYWICLGCGEMLINPEVDAEDNIAWICDQCESMLNIQPGFADNDGEWTCTVCGFRNRIDNSEVFATDQEYRSYLKDPYKGLNEEALLELSFYQDESFIKDRPDIILVQHRETGKRYLKKLLTTYNRSIYEFLEEHPIDHMPKILALYESENSLVVLEEFVEGKTVADLLEENGSFPEEKAISIARAVCIVLDQLHSLTPPLIHRDIKPSNIILTPEGEVFLLDINVARWYDENKSDDTEYMGTQFFAAPEQAGFGLASSSAKTDIYGVGVFLNVMLTGSFPKEKRAEGKVWDVIERCISLDAEKRYTASELIKVLDTL